MGDLFQDLEELLGVQVHVITRNALKPRDDRIRSEAVDLRAAVASCIHGGNWSEN
jgi:predicted nucleotidyltransferase